MTEFKMPKRDRSPGLMPSPRTEEPEYPALTGLVVQVAALRGCVEKLEGERDAAVARANSLAVDLAAAVIRADRAAGAPNAMLATEAAEGHEQEERPVTEMWWAFECFTCFHEFGDSGLVFDVRLPASMDLPTAKCPRCGTICSKPQTWGATDGGYGGRGDGGLPDRIRKLEAQIKRHNTALGGHTEAPKTLNNLPATQETILATTVAPTAVDHGAALLDLVAAANDCMFQLELERLAETLIEALADERAKNDALTNQLMALRVAKSQTEYVSDEWKERTLKAEAAVEFNVLRAETAEARQAAWLLGYNEATARVEKSEADLARLLATNMALAGESKFAEMVPMLLAEQGAKNYVEVQLVAGNGAEYVMIFQRKEGQSPHQLRTAAEAALTRRTVERDRARDEMRRRFCKDGECPDGREHPDENDNGDCDVCPIAAALADEPEVGR